MSGASSRSLLWNVTLPLILPALVAAAMYVAIVAVGAFDIPAVIGMGSRVYTFSTFMFVHAYPADGFPDYGTIAAGGAVMIAFALAMTFAYGLVLRRARSFAVITGKAYRPRLTELGRWRVAAWAFVALYVFGALVIPFAFTLIYALLPFAEPLSMSVFAHMSLTNFAQIPWNLVLTGATHTAELVIVVPIAVVALSFAISWIVVRTNLRGRFVLDGIAFMPHAVPGILFGIGASLLALFVLQKIVPIYGTRRVDRHRVHDRLDQLRHAHHEQQSDPDPHRPRRSRRDVGCAYRCGDERYRLAARSARSDRRVDLRRVALCARVDPGRVRLDAEEPHASDGGVVSLE